MKKVHLLTCLVFAVIFSKDAAAKVGFSVDHLLSWETAVGLLNDEQSESHYYAAVVVRTSNQFFGWPSQRAYELGGIAVIERDVSVRRPEDRALMLETPIIGVSENFEIVSNKYFSLEVGIGGYLKKPTNSVGSVFTFGERVALKSSIKSFEMEIFYRHFSNGSFTTDNSGYDFVGLSFTSRF